jgi:hypothetical protein
MQLTIGSSLIHSNGSRVIEIEVEVQRHSSSGVTETDTKLQVVSLEFFIDVILPVTLWPWG